MVLVDTNVLVRALQREHPMPPAAWSAVRRLFIRQELVLAAQNIVELWVAATRPKQSNGLGMAVEKAAL